MYVWLCRWHFTIRKSHRLFQQKKKEHCQSRSETMKKIYKSDEVFVISSLTWRICFCFHPSSRSRARWILALWINARPAKLVITSLDVVVVIDTEQSKSQLNGEKIMDGFEYLIEREAKREWWKTKPGGKQLRYLLRTCLDRSYITSVSCWYAESMQYYGQVNKIFQDSGKCLLSISWTLESFSAKSLNSVRLSQISK